MAWIQNKNGFAGAEHECKKSAAREPTIENIFSLAFLRESNKRTDVFLSVIFVYFGNACYFTSHRGWRKPRVKFQNTALEMFCVIIFNLWTTGIRWLLFPYWSLGSLKNLEFGHVPNRPEKGLEKIIFKIKKVQDMTGGATISMHLGISEGSSRTLKWKDRISYFRYLILLNGDHVCQIQHWVDLKIN